MKANFLIEFETIEEFYEFETWLKRHLKFDVTILPDTKELYDKDPNLRELTKHLKECKKIYNDYINENNYKK